MHFCVEKNPTQHFPNWDTLPYINYDTLSSSDVDLFSFYQVFVIILKKVNSPGK